MMTAYEVIRGELLKCAGGDDLILPNGWFVRKLNQDQPLRYLHKVYVSLPRHDFATVTDVLGFPPPTQYRKFLRECGGVSLFDRSMHLFGYDPYVTRSLRLEDQRAIQIFTPIEEFRLSPLGSDEAGRWCPVGSIVLCNKVWMVIDRNGFAALVHDDCILEFASFDAMIERVALVLSAEIGCGPRPVGDNQQIEASLLSTVH